MSDWTGCEGGTLECVESASSEEKRIASAILQN